MASVAPLPLASSVPAAPVPPVWPVQQEPGVPGGNVTPGGPEALS